MAPHREPGSVTQVSDDSSACVLSTLLHIEDKYLAPNRHNVFIFQARLVRSIKVLSESYLYWFGVSVTGFSDQLR